MRKEKKKGIHTNEDWLKEKYVFVSNYNAVSKDKHKNISKLYRDNDKQYTDTVHLSKTFLERFFK